MKGRKHYIWLGLKAFGHDALMLMFKALPLVITIAIFSGVYGVGVYYSGGEGVLPNWFTWWAYGCAVFFSVLFCGCFCVWIYRGIRAIPYWLEEKGRKYENPTNAKVEAARQRLRERDGFKPGRER